MLGNTRLGLLLFLALVLAACKPAQGPASTATITSEDVLMTAEAIAEATRNAVPPTASPTPVTPTATAILETATPLATSTPLLPVVAADYNANVRSGPDEVFPAVDVLLQGNTANVVGRYTNASNGIWWSIHRVGPGLDGWVWGGAVTLSGDANLVPFLVSPPTPEFEPTEKPKKTNTPEPSVTPTT